MKIFDVTRNPKDGQWYVIGRLTRKYWMPISDGVRSKAEAEQLSIHLQRAERAAKLELKGWEGGA